MIQQQIETLDHDQIAIDYDFWDKNLLQKTQVYLEIMIKDEVLTKHKQFPVFRDYYLKIYKLLDERIKNPDKDLNGWAPWQMAATILYIISGISEMGFNLHIFRLVGLVKLRRIEDYILNTIDILDWYKQTQEYKVWKEEQEWRQAHPMYASKPKEGKELAKMIALTNKNMKSGKYAKDRVLKNIK
jgi:hypothetical protein